MDWAENAVRQAVKVLTVEAFVRAGEGAGAALEAVLSQWSPGDATGEASTFSLRYADPVTGEGGKAAPSFVLRTEGGVHAVRGREALAPGWRHLAGIYDGQEASLLVDGEVVARVAAAGAVLPCPAPVAEGCQAPGEAVFAGHVERARIFHAVVAEREMGMVSHDAHGTIPKGLELRLQPATLFVMDDREELAGHVGARADAAALEQVAASRDAGLELSLRRRGATAVLWSTQLPLDRLAPRCEIPFAVPVGSLPGGYYDLAVEPVAGSRPAAGLGPGRADRRQISFAKLRTGCAPAPAPAPGRARYLSFVREAVDILIQHQSARWGGEAAGALFLTGNGKHHLGYGSLVRKADGELRFGGRFPEHPFELESRRCDFELWPVLDELSRLTGDGRYAGMVEAMAATVATGGFDPRSGLFYYSEESDLDVVARAPRGIGDHQVPRFKPINSGNCPQMPLDRLWGQAPEQMRRCARSMFQGLVTNPATMDFNRFTFYGYDDDGRRPAMTATPSNLGFDSAATRMIHWWTAAYGRAGDGTCLDWARRLAAKWQAVQHPDSGLVPNFFGDGEWGPGQPQPVGRWAEVRGAALTAAGYMDAVGELEGRSEVRDLADLLTDMAVRLALGVARHSYDAERGLFVEHLHLDGRPYRESARYAFHSQTEKEAAMRADPAMAEVPVYVGDGWYEPATFSRPGAGTTIPWHLALVAEGSGNGELRERLAAMAGDAVRAASGARPPFTAEARWTFPATGLYLKLLVSLYRMTGEERYVREAMALADAELDALPTVECPEWWRLRERAVLLDGLLRLYEAAG